MAYPGYGMEAAANFQGLFSNVLMALRYKQANQELSLREKSFLEEQRRNDQNYELKLEEFDYRKKQDDFTRQYQRSQMRAMDVNFNNEQASVAVAPYLAKFQSDLTNITDPEEVKRFSPDASFIDSLPEEQRMKANAIWSTGVQASKNAWMAQTGITQLNQKKADNLLENSHLLEGAVAQQEAMELGYMMKAGGSLPPESRELYNRFASEIEKRRPPTSVEASAYVALAKDEGDRYDANLKEMREALKVVDVRYPMGPQTEEEKKAYEEEKIKVATPYILAMQESRKNRSEYARAAIGDRGVARGIGETAKPQVQTEATPQAEPVRLKAIDLLPMKPSQKKSAMTPSLETPAQTVTPTTQSPIVGDQTDNPETRRPKGGELFDKVSNMLYEDEIKEYQRLKVEIKKLPTSRQGQGQKKQMEKRIRQLEEELTKLGIALP